MRLNDLTIAFQSADSIRKYWYKYISSISEGIANCERKGGEITMSFTYAERYQIAQLMKMEFLTAMGTIVANALSFADLDPNRYRVEYDGTSTTELRLTRNRVMTREEVFHHRSAA